MSAGDDVVGEHADADDLECHGFAGAHVDDSRVIRQGPPKHPHGDGTARPDPEPLRHVAVDQHLLGSVRAGHPTGQQSGVAHKEATLPVRAHM